MRAVTYSRYGGPEVLELADVAKPVPGESDVLIRVGAAEAAKSDCEMRSFRFSVKWFWLPLRLALGVRRPRRRVLGIYFAGEVEAVGRHVTRFAPGDIVYGATGLRTGAYGEYVALAESSAIAPKPENMTFAEAAAVPLGGLNALHFMGRARIEHGERILVNGAGGSIGAHAVQIARSMGAEVTGVDHGIKEAFVRGLGASDFVDYTTDDITASGRTFDVIFDMVAGSSYRRLVGMLEPGGRYLAGNPRLSVIARSVLTTRFTDKTATVAFADETSEALASLTAMIEAEEIRPIVERVYPMEEAAAAHQRVETEKRVGAIVIAIGDRPQPSNR